MIKVKTKKRREKENYEEYCKITLAYSNIHGKKFLNALKVILEDIRSRNFTPASSEDYKKLNKKFGGLIRYMEKILVELSGKL